MPTRTSRYDRLPRERLDTLLRKIRACTVCAPYLPLGPAPLLQAGTTARLLIVSQAPSAKAHLAGIPWHDASGRRLRAWLGIDDAVFYDPARVAIVPMGFCYPGRGPHGDLPPRPECAPLWHDRVMAQLPQVQLTLLIGAWAQRHFLGDGARLGVTETVAAFTRGESPLLALPHPSPRNTAWFRRHPWFEHELLPLLRRRVATVLDLSVQGASTMATRKSAKHDIVLQRAYEEPTPHDGYRVLIDHFWPRGRSKDVLKLDEWAKDIAPTAELIHWYGHVPERWPEFQRRYMAELAEPAQQARLHALLEAAGKQRLTLVYGARTETQNQAVVVREALLALR